MLSVIYGVNGSGKSYYAVRLINEKMGEGWRCITNIKTKIQGVEYYSDIQIREKIITPLVEGFKKSKSIEERVKLMQKVFDTDGKENFLVIFDECHFLGFNDNGKEGLELLKFLTIHRHTVEDKYSFDIYLLTQTVSQLRTDIKELATLHVYAVAPTERLNVSLFEYHYFPSYGLIQNYSRSRNSTGRIKIERLKYDKQIGKLYRAGSNQKGLSDFRKKLYIAISVVIIGGIFSVYMLYRSYGHIVGTKKHINENIDRLNNEIKKKSDYINHNDYNNSNYLHNNESKRIIAFCSKLYKKRGDVEDCDEFFTLIKKGKKPYIIYQKGSHRVWAIEGGE